LRLPNLKGIVLNPSWLGKVLGELLLRDGHWLCIAIEQHRPGAGGALVKCKDVLHDSKINRKPPSEKETISPIDRIGQNKSNFEQSRSRPPSLSRE
jgi:hypothetical protein